MSKTQNPDPVALAMVRKRWDKASAEDKSLEGRRLAEARWKGHVPKKAGQKKKVGRPKKKAGKGKKAK
jgi:hypothetical protein